uniref:Aminotran_1_2 domain-containing protein n=1 Tax=Caenorhabditis japonica TaxID=281687 RepID=A0A8R1HKF0_CAEJA
MFNMLAAPSVNVKDGGRFSADSQGQTTALNSDDEQLDDVPYLSHQLSEDHESFSEKFLRNILTHDYQNLMPRRREKFVEITKTVTVTEIVNGAPDKHPSSCEVKVTNVLPAGPHPVNVSIKHLHEKWHSNEELDQREPPSNHLGKGTVIRIHETHAPFNSEKASKKPPKFVYEDVIDTQVETKEKSSPSPARHRNNNMSANSSLFNKSSDNIIDLEFRHPILVETEDSNKATMNGGNTGTRRRFADLRKRVSTTTKTSMTETEKVTTTRRSSSAHSTSSSKRSRSYGKPEVQTLYYRKFVDEETKKHDDDMLSDSGSVIDHQDSTTQRSKSADPFRTSSPISPVAPPRKRLGREESLHYYRDDEEVHGQMRSPEPGNTSVGMNNTMERQNLTAGITSITMNNSCTDTSIESRFSTFPRARSSPPGAHRVNHIQVNVIGPIKTSEDERRSLPVYGRVGEDVTMDIHIKHRRKSSLGRRSSASHVIVDTPPPKPPRRSKWEDHQQNLPIGDPLATSTPMTTIQRKQTREERISVEGESGQSSRKSTRSARPPDINITECETFIKETRSPARTPATPIVVINQTPSSRRSSQDLLGEPGQRRRKSTVTDIDWYAAFNMKDPSSPTKPVRPPVVASQGEDRRNTKDLRRRASESSMFGLPPADIDLNQIFSCMSPEDIKKDEKCQCNACRLIRMSEAEREMRRETRNRQSRTYKRTFQFVNINYLRRYIFLFFQDTRSSTLPSRHRTAPVDIHLEDVFNPKPQTKPPTPPTKHRQNMANISSSVDESQHSRIIDRNQVTRTSTTNSITRDSQLHVNGADKLLPPTSSREDVDWVGQMMHAVNDWEEQRGRKISTSSTTSNVSIGKTSIARRISVDELTKKKRKKSHKAVPLPPSDVSLEDIFSALTQKDQKKEQKTFIITRKQRAQDANPIDFEGDRKKEHRVEIAQDEKPFEVKDDSIADAFNPKSVEVVIPLVAAPDTESIVRQEVSPKNEIVTSSATITLDDRKNKDNQTTTTFIESIQSEKGIDPSQHKTNVTSTANISLDDVFKTDGFKKPDAVNEEEDMKIKKQIEEFENNEAEKKTQIQLHEIPTTQPRTFEETNISMDDIFSGNQSQSMTSIPISKDVLEEEERMEKRIEEFEKTQEEQDIRREETVENHHSTEKNFEDSEISMDDVFRTTKSGTSSEALPKQISSASINLSSVFDTEGLKKPDAVNENEENKIKKQIAEFEKNEEEKANQVKTESKHHDVKKIFNDSNISMDDIFVGTPKSTSDGKIAESKELVEEEKRMEKRIEEFEKSKEEQESRREETIETHHFTEKIFKDSEISMDDVFSTKKSGTSSEKLPKETYSALIKLSSVFDTKDLKKPEAVNADEEKKIQKQDSEFGKNEDEKANLLKSESKHQDLQKIFDDSNISLDDIFVGTPKSTSDGQIAESKELVEEEKRMEKRIAEFEKTKDEQEIRREETVETHHFTGKIFQDSEIYINDVFSPTKSDTSSEALPKQISSASINLSSVFDTKDLKKPETVNEDKEKKIQKQFSELENNEEEKANQVKTEAKLDAVQKIIADSSISMDDIFVGTPKHASEGQTVKSEKLVKDEKRMEKRIEEFAKTKEEQEVRREETIETLHSTEKIFKDSEISMEDVFSPTKSDTSSEALPKQISSASINLSSVFDTDGLKRPEAVNEDEEKKIQKQISEFEKSEEEKANQVKTESKHHDVQKIFDDSNISLEDVFVGNQKNSSDGQITESKELFEEEKRMEKRIEEFEKTKEEQDIRKEETVETHHSTEKIFEDSEISMDVVFSATKSGTSSENLPRETSSASINLSSVFDTKGLKKPDAVNENEEKKIKKQISEFEKNEEEKANQVKTESKHHDVQKIFNDSNILLDDIFVGTPKSTSDGQIAESKELLDEEKRMEKRIEEFEKTKDEQEIRREETVETHHSTGKVFKDSEISMDDVFSPTKSDTSSEVLPKQISSASINLSSVFDTKDLKKPEAVIEDEEKKIQKQNSEFGKNEDEKANFLKSESKHQDVQKIFDDSNISLDDIFVSTPKSTSDGQITESKDLVEEEKRMEKRIEEFEKTQEEKEIRREETIETRHSTGKVFQDSEISMDDVFSATKSGTSSENLPRETSSASINLSSVFDTEGLKKPDAVNEDEEKKIKKQIAEFEKSEEEKTNQVKRESKHLDVQIFNDSNISLDEFFVGHPKDTSDGEIAESNELFEEGKRMEKQIEEFEKTKDEQEIRQEETDETHHSTGKIFVDSQISLDDVFTPTKSDRHAAVLPKQISSASINMISVSDTEGLKKPDAVNKYEENKIKRQIAEFDKNEDEKANQLKTETKNHDVHKLFDDSNISMDDIFIGHPKDTSGGELAESKELVEEEKRMEKRIEEFEKTKDEQEIRREETVETHHSAKKIFVNSQISMDDVFSPTKPGTSSEKLPRETSSASINLRSVFDTEGLKKPDAVNEEEEKKIKKQIAEFEKNEDEKANQLKTESKHHYVHKLFDDSNISMDDIFVGYPKDTSDGKVAESKDLDEEEKRMEKRIEEFEKTKDEEKIRREETVEIHHSPENNFENSEISMDDVFNPTTSHESSLAIALSGRNEHQPHSSKTHHTRQEIFVDSNRSNDKINDESHTPASPKISLDDIFPDTNMLITTTESKVTKTTTTTTTETTFSSTTTIARNQHFSDDLLEPQTSTHTAIPTLAITTTKSDHLMEPFRPANSLTGQLQVPTNWNESMRSTSSTISLDDSYNNSFAVLQPKSSAIKMRKELTLPVDNWIDTLVATATNEATKEAPKTPNYHPSPTRISQEIKYEWVANLVGTAEEEEEEEHQSEEQHRQTQDNTWVSSVVYRPTLETTVYTLRASQSEDMLDMDRVFNECLMGKMKDNEECECSACRITEQELLEKRYKQIETPILRQEEAVQTPEFNRRDDSILLSPSNFSIDDVFPGPLSVETDTGNLPSTSTPPIQSIRTYYLSPTVAQTVTTTHQWKEDKEDADISMDEIFSPISMASTSGNDNRRFSNFYEDRLGWNTFRSEDSGVLSGGGRRRSSQIIPDQIIDEAFKEIFKDTTTKTDRTGSTQYENFYITSQNPEEDVETSDSEVDGENLDVTQFVDDILGKSLDEAAFLSSTKSFRNHTDTSIDRKISGEQVHSYYRTRTDTSIDRRQKPNVISEEAYASSSNDEILKLVFAEHSSQHGRANSPKANEDNELLEIEIRPEYFLIKGSYSLLIPKTDVLGQMLQKIRDQNGSLATLDFSLARKLKKLLVSCIREKAESTEEMASSKYNGLSSRGQSLIDSVDHASATFLKMNVNKYEAEKNPRGIVNFCTAENNICTPLLEERFQHIELFFPHAEHLTRYPPSGGWPEAREVLVTYFKEFMGAKVSAEELVLTASTRTGYDVVSYCLFEADDILLTNGPVYTGTISNVNERAQCVVECVETDFSNPRIDLAKYEAAYEHQLSLDNTVAGVIIVNPHNPLGVVFPPEDVVSLCNWATSKNLRVVIDEVFANCVFDKTYCKFRPFLSYRYRVHKPENVAWMWSVSKDFGLPGLKYAVIHTANEGLRRAATKLQLYHPCSPFVQDFAAKLLSDSEWLREFHTEVTKRMAIHYRYTAENLSRLDIPFVPAQAGIFVFANFSKHCTTLDTAGELDLFDRLATSGIMLTPGVHQKCHVPGWFRLVFACTKEELEEGIRRLYTFLGSPLEPTGMIQYN